MALHRPTHKVPPDQNSCHNNYYKRCDEQLGDSSACHEYKAKANPYSILASFRTVFIVQVSALKEVCKGALNGCGRFSVQKERNMAASGSSSFSSVKFFIFFQV